MRKPKTKKPAKGRKTMKFSDFKRLSFCNSRKLPDYVEIAGRRHEWVGIGWVDVGRADGTEVVITEDDGTWAS